MLTPETWVDLYGNILYKYALARVRKPEVAEDLVQETFLAALKSRDKFEGRSTESTWLSRILRNKIVDYYRQRSRGIPEAEQVSHEDWLDAFFDESGRWIYRPDANAIKPDSLVEKEEFWNVFDACLDKLPERSREIFVRRVLENETTKDICKILKVSSSNLYVILYRARTQMRHCLTLNWFQS